MTLPLAIAHADYMALRNTVEAVEREAYERAGGPCLVAMSDHEAAEAQAAYEAELEERGFGFLQAQLAEAEEALVAAAAAFIAIPEDRREALVAALDVAC